LAKRVAVIDIGSNSVRMVVYEKTSRFAFHLLHEAKSRVRISENAYQNDGALQEEPMQRTLDALRDFLSIASSLKARKTLCVATSALRDAPNRYDFLQRVREELKLGIKVIDGKKEAYFGGLACANLLPTQHNALTIDIGGGSTEFARFDEKNVTNTISLKLGTVRLKELFFDKDDLKGAKKYIDQELDKLDLTNIDAIAGIGGTFRAISNAMMENSEYPLNKIHGYETSQKKFEIFIDAVLAVKNEDALIKLGIKPDRFDVIKPGSLILKQLLLRLDVQTLIASGVGVREGVYLHDMLRNSKGKFPSNYNTSVRFLLDSHIIDANFSNQLNKLAKKIFDLVEGELGLTTSYRYELATAAKLYPIGSNIHYYSKNKHSYYLIQSALEYGFTHAQIMLIATLARYAKRKLPSKSHVQKYSELLPQRKELDILSYILSISIALLSHRPRDIDFSLRYEDRKLYVASKSTLYLAQDAIKKLQAVREIELVFEV
jgi:exopolyphosphatase/guanosine-5'-triphosphate,3'-diphosphate pyrophosphatase